MKFVSPSESGETPETNNKFMPSLVTLAVSLVVSCGVVFPGLSSDPLLKVYLSVC